MSTPTTSMNELDVWIIFLIMVICLGFGLWVGIMVGEHSEQKRIVIDQQHLIYDSVLYKRAVPTE